MPTFSNQTGKIYFLGGIPGGYSGDGILGRIIFRAKKEGKAQVKFDETCQVLLNDGLGTPAKLKTEGANFEILAQKREVPQNEWEELLKGDKNPPERFKIKIGKDPSVFGGKYFIVFSTADKESGIDHYEVKEGEGEWKIEKSPYLLKDQSLKSKILVKAIDKASNERIEKISPSFGMNWKNALLFLIPILLLAGIIFWLFKKFHPKIK
jgi:hypothetical protein